MKDKREQMVDVIKSRYGLISPDVLSVMLQVPRHKFVLKENQNSAYDDIPVPIGFDQTMSQPYTVAVMTKLITEALNPKHEIPAFAGRRNKFKFIKSKIPKKVKKYGKVLEIGTGSGYQAAVLSKLFKEVYTVEIIPQLAKKAKRILQKLEYKNVFVKEGSGEWGWKEKSPFDAIMITAGVRGVPKELFNQLKDGGVLVAPVGKGKDKVMTRYMKLKDGLTEKRKDKKTEKSLSHAHGEPKNEGIGKLKNGKTKRLINKVTKLPSNQVTKQLKTEKFGTFHFVPFVEEGN